MVACGAKDSGIEERSGTRRLKAIKLEKEEQQQLRTVLGGLVSTSLNARLESGNFFPAPRKLLVMSRDMDITRGKSFPQERNDSKDLSVLKSRNAIE